jgi:hypothetical protein
VLLTRKSLQLELIAVEGVIRSAFRQLDGSLILTSECLCSKDPFTCPIDKHALAARAALLETLYP